MDSFSKIENFKFLKVYYKEKTVGTLARTPENLVAFEYDADWLARGFSISPLSLPLEKRVFVPKFDPFQGLFGVFNDTLPDGWGRLLVDRAFLKAGIAPQSIDPLNRLAVVGDFGMGALSYKPVYELKLEYQNLDFDTLARSAKEILKSKDCTDNLDELFTLGGSSGGARPKVLVKIDNEDWIVKFPSSSDRDNIGEIEYEYSLCAKDCGIIMPETRLLNSKICSGYFAVKRFDRVSDKKIHMISASGLLETSHRLPNLDYNTLMKLTLDLTRDYRDIEQLYRIMCFNVFSHNRDDHSKNFSYLYDALRHEWHLTPAYDLTYSFSIGGEHATTVNGEGKNPQIDNILEVARKINFKTPKKARDIALDIKDKTKKLQKYW